MIKLDNNFLAELGLGDLPASEKNEMLNHIYKTLETRVGMYLADRMTESQMQEFEAFIPNDQAGALKWLETNFPNYRKVVTDELDKLKKEISQVAPQIIARSKANNPEQPAPASAPNAQPPAPTPQPTPVQSQPPTPSSNPSAGPAPQSVDSTQNNYGYQAPPSDAQPQPVQQPQQQPQYSPTPPPAPQQPAGPQFSQPQSQAAPNPVQQPSTPVDSGFQNPNPQPPQPQNDTNNLDNLYNSAAPPKWQPPTN